MPVCAMRRLRALFCLQCPTAVFILTLGERLHAKDIVCMLSGRLQGSLFPQQRWRPGLWFVRRWTRWSPTSASQACCHPAFELRMRFKTAEQSFS